MSKPGYGQSRAAILSAALELFAEQGFSGTSTIAIAQRAGVAQPLIHHYFGSKAGLWQASLADIFTDLHETLEPALVQLETPADFTVGLRDLLEALTLFCVRRPQIARFLLIESNAQDDRVQAGYAAHVLPVIERIHQALATGISAGLVKPVPVDMLVRMAIGAILEPWRSPEQVRMRGQDSTDSDFALRYATLVYETITIGLLHDDHRPR